MQAIILAGGLGTRLKDVVSDIPKVMAPIKGIPFLSFILNQLNNHGFEKAVLAVGYLGEIVEDYFGYKFKDLELVYSYEEKPLGTGGCVLKSLQFINDDYVYIINGDTFFDVDFGSFRKPKNVAISCKYLSDTGRYGKVVINKAGLISEFQEKKSDGKGYINGGIYCIRTSLMSSYDFANTFSLERDFFEKFVHNLEIEAHVSDGYFIDIGVPRDYEKAQNELQL